MSITYIPPRKTSLDGLVRADGTVPLTGIWNTGNFNIFGPSAVYKSNTAPANPYLGMLWNDTSVFPRFTLREWSGSAWLVVYSYETIARGFTIVHDHGALLTGASILAAYDGIGKFGGTNVQLSIENKTFKHFISAPAVDAGSGNVKLPLASGHGFVSGEKVCIDGTTNYDGVFDIGSVEDGYIIIPATYVAETISDTAVVRVVIDTSGLTIKGSFNNVTLYGKYADSSINQKQPVVFFSVSSTPLYITSMAFYVTVEGIKLVSKSASNGLYINFGGYYAVRYCAFDTFAQKGLAASNGTIADVEGCSFKNIENSAIHANLTATVTSKDNSSVSGVKYGLVADYGGTIKKVSSTQPAGTTANEYAVTSRAGQII